MDFIQETIGQGKDLSFVQMSVRAILIFIIAYILIRISGRRSFGLHSPLDNIIVILLGALLSRAIVGASPFLPVIGASFIVVLLHRFFGIMISKSYKLSLFAEGKKIILYEKGKFLQSNIQKCLICKEEIMHAVRAKLFTEDLFSIDKIYMERNGEITIIKKN